MSTHDTFAAGSLALVLSIAAGCSPTLQDGRFTCSMDDECPTGFVCRASDGLCYREGSDGGPRVDAASSPEAGIDAGIEAGIDAALRDGEVPIDANLRDAAGDAPTGCGTNCIQLMVLNADLGAIGTMEYQDRDGALHGIPIPPYGTTSETIDVPNVPVGGVLMINVPPTATFFQALDIPRETRYLMVLGPSSLGSEALMLESPIAGLHTGGYVYIELIDMTDDTAGLLASGAGRDSTEIGRRNAFEQGTISAELPFLPGSTGALSLELDTASRPLLAALLADQIPGTEGTYYVVVTGRVAQHLDEGDGLRFIPGLPGATTLRSAPLVRFLNTTETTMVACDGSTSLAVLAPGVLSPPRVPPASEPWALDVHVGTGCTTGDERMVSVGTGVGRTLVSIAGDTTDVARWRAVSISEPMPMAPNSTIVIHNGLPTPAVIAGSAATIPSLGTGVVTEVSPPATITAATMDGNRTFLWSPTARQSWVVVTYEGGAAYTAHEVDSPFEMPWTVTAVPGT